MSDPNITLARTLDLLAATPLKTQIAARAGHQLVLDASGVEKLGAQCLQVLLAARAMWRAENIVFAISDPSEAFREQVRLMGAGNLLEEQAMGEVCP